MTYLETQIHKHHIVPTYAGGTNNPSNLVELTEREHAHIHWWMYLNERRNVFNLLESKGVKITKEMIEHIPFGNKNDSGAAGLLARGQIDGIDMSGENNPMWKGGITYDMKAYRARPESIAAAKKSNARPERIVYNKEYRETPENKVKRKERDQRPEALAKRREYEERPEVKAMRQETSKTPEALAKRREYMKELRKTPGWTAKRKEYMKAYNEEYHATPENIARAKELRDKPEAKAKKKEYQRAYRARKKQC